MRMCDVFAGVLGRRRAGALRQLPGLVPPGVHRPDHAGARCMHPLKTLKWALGSKDVLRGAAAALQPAPLDWVFCFPTTSAPAGFWGRGHFDWCCIACSAQLSWHAGAAACVQDVTSQSGRWACPHHSCGECGRGTGAAGGLLFRCQVDITPGCYCNVLEGQHIPARQAVTGDKEAVSQGAC